MRTYLIHAIAVFLLATGTAALAQTQLQPGPTKPPPTTSPLTKPGADMVINPTTEECRSGWSRDLKWTKEQFESHCEQMKASR